MDTFEKAFPTAIRPQGKEIVRTWLQYTLLKSVYCLINRIQTRLIDGLGMDPWGRKMSKSQALELDDGVLECEQVEELLVESQGA